MKESSTLLFAINDDDSIDIVVQILPGKFRWWMRLMFWKYRPMRATVKPLYCHSCSRVLGWGELRYFDKDRTLCPGCWETENKLRVAEVEDGR